MSSSSSTNPITLGVEDKLKGYENYAHWKVLMEAHGKPKGLHKYWQNKITVPTDYEDEEVELPVDFVEANDSDSDTTIQQTTDPKGKRPQPKQPKATDDKEKTTPLHSTTPTLLEYELRESVALSSILINVVDIYGSGIDPNKRSHQVWKALEAQYGRASDRARNMREEALANCKLAEGGKVAGEDGHIEKMRKLRQRANEAGAKISDQRFITRLLDSFPESWDPVITPMYGESDLSRVVMNLTTHAERLSIREAKSKKPAPPSDAVKALEATITALQAEVKSLRTENRRSGGGNSNLKCSNPACGKTGHLIADCFQQGGGKAGQYPHWWKGKRTAPATTPTANMATTSTSASASGPVVTGLSYALTASVDVNRLNEIIAKNAHIEQKVALAAAADPTANITSACVADSGCTTYFFKDKSAFTEYREIKLTGQSSKADAHFAVLGIGKVAVNVVHNNKQHTLTFNDALHAPDITANLISIGKLDSLGWHTLFGDKKVRFFHGKDEVFGGELRNGLYMISGSIVSKLPTALTAKSLREPVDMDTWHRRMGHFGVKRIGEAAKLVSGLEVVDGKSHGDCEDCIIANQKRRPYDEEITPTDEVLKITNIDLWGPARVKSAGGALYAMKFHDNGSSRRKSFFLENRLAETVLHAFKTYKALSENLTGKTMKFVRTDNAPEFLSSLWTDFMRENGIKLIPTAPYSSSANGTAERSIGITTGSVRAMLLDSGLNAKWWAEAWAFSDMVENLLPSSRHPKMIPEERWTGEKQDVGHIRVWGCVAYVHIPREKGNGKLGDRGQKGRLVGIEGRGTYRVLIPETGQIVRSRNVRFEEGHGHRTLTADGQYSTEFFTNDNGDMNYDFLDGNEAQLVETDESESTPDGELKTRISRPRKVYPPASRHSARVANRQLGNSTSPNRSDDINNPSNITDPITLANDETTDDEENEATALAAQSLPILEPLNRYIPQNHNEALDLSRRHLWLPAMQAEIEKWDEKGVVTPVEWNKDMPKVIDLMWRYQEKTDAVGELVKRKARCVAKGFKMVLGEHYWETFAAVVRYESVRMLFGLAAALSLKLHLVDVVTAFLNAKPQALIYVAIPPGFQNHYAIPGATKTVLRLNQNLYGTMDGANNWAKLLNTTFRELGHRQSKADPCMRIQYTKDGGYTLSATYTDDIMTASSTTEAENQTTGELGKAYEVTDHGRPKVVLGMGTVYHENGDISIHQKSLTSKALEDFGMQECNPKYTPLPSSLNLNDSQPKPIPDEDAYFMRDKDYRKACGTFNHLAIGTRPDIAFAVMLLMRYMADPRPIHWRLALHLLAYLKATQNLGIRYRKDADIKPIGYADSSFADDVDTRKSSAGYVFISGGGAIGWRAKTQRRISTSTGEAEYVEVFEAGKQAKWLTSWYKELDKHYDGPVTIYCDNDVAVSLTKNTSGHSRIKHVDINTHWIREAVEMEDIKVLPIAGDDNPADIFTKSLGRTKHEKFMKMLGMESLEI